MFTKSTLSITLLATTLSACATSGGPGYDSTYPSSDGYKTQAYLECERRDNKNQVIGGVVGAVVGGVVGNEIDDGAGKYIGAGAGALAGAKIGDKNCDKYLDPRYDTDRYTQRRNFGNDRDYTVDGVTYYTERDVNFAIDDLQAEDERLEYELRQTNSQYERDRIQQRREAIRRAVRDLDDVESRFKRYN